MTQPTLLDVAERQIADTPRKRVQATSAAQYQHLLETGTLAKRRMAVLRAVAALREQDGRWPTACEVQRHLADSGAIPNDGNPNHVKPRLSELADGWTVTKRDTQGQPVKVHVPCHVLVRGAKRKSDVTNISVITWQIREVGA